MILLTIANSCSSGITDGKYCADIEMHNWKTDKDAFYTLPVEVVNNKIVKIYWSNGGWLDETHFDPDEADIDLRDNSALFEDDRERMFLIKILENETCN